MGGNHLLFQLALAVYTPFPSLTLILIINPSFPRDTSFHIINHTRTFPFYTSFHFINPPFPSLTSFHFHL